MTTLFIFPILLAVSQPVVGHHLELGKDSLTGKQNDYISTSTVIIKSVRGSAHSRPTSMTSGILVTPNTVLAPFTSKIMDLLHHQKVRAFLGSPPKSVSIKKFTQMAIVTTTIDRTSFNAGVLDINVTESDGVSYAKFLLPGKPFEKIFIPGVKLIGLYVTSDAEGDRQGMKVMDLVDDAKCEDMNGVLSTYLKCFELNRETKKGDYDKMHFSTVQMVDAGTRTTNDPGVYTMAFPMGHPQCPDTDTEHCFMSAVLVTHPTILSHLKTIPGIQLISMSA